MPGKSDIRRKDFVPQYALGIHDDDDERVVLGTIVDGGDALQQARELLVPEAFYVDKHRDIYRAILAVADRGAQPDILLVKNELQKMQAAIELSELMGILQNRHFGDVYPIIAHLRDLHLRRKLYLLGQDLVKAGSCEAEDIEDVQLRAREVIDNLCRKAPGGISTLDDALTNLNEIIKANMAGGTGLTGTPTGFHALDDKGGLHKSDLIVIAAATSQGKTAFATDIAVNAIQQGAKIAVYSLEMMKEQLAARIVAGQSGVSSSDMLYHALTPEQLGAVDKAIGALCGKNLFFDDRSTSNIDTILASIRSMKLKYDIDGVILDYLQIISVNTKLKDSTREQLMGDVARRLKNIAKDLGIWVIALSQFNRDKANPLPTLNRLRESGQIAEAADTVMLIYRPEYFNDHEGLNLRYPAPYGQVDVKGTAMIDVAKGRNIGTMHFFCRFDARLTHFQDVQDYRTLPTLREAEEENPY